ncbi:MAG: hypothetical protein CVT78_13870 [Alphaproteobacteria bacterium HGW-Alphaproteobacteria-17]|nr:MAG: hypothetical protein CVT78_13870 [Alphaproteobacteria bacterium HGW-Alphaproteobacteria-17]
MTRAMMRLLMILGVLLCSMHLAEPASAHSSNTAFHLVTDSGEKDQHEPASNVVHGGHHHCPVAPDLRQSAADADAALIRGLLFASLALQLTSRAPPPLLDPPLA